MLLGFDPNAEVAIAQLAEAAYARNPIPRGAGQRVRRARRNRLRQQIRARLA